MKKSIIALLVAISLIFTLLGCQKKAAPIGKQEVEPYSLSWQDNGDIEVIRQRICEGNYDTEVDITEIMENLQEDGSFKNIDYYSERKDDWQPINHIKTILKMQKACNTPGNTFYNNEEVRAGVTSAMKFWIEKDFHCDWNNWYNNIGLGMYLPDILLFGVNNLTTDEQTKLLSNFKKTLLHSTPFKADIELRPVDDAGGNLTDQTIATLKVAVIENDGNTIMWLKSIMENELKPFPSYVEGKNRTDYQGIKEDMSFQQHDQLLYLGGYGEVFMDGVNRFLNYTNDTQYALNEKAVNLYTDFILDGMQYATRNGYRDISASGRGISRKNDLKGIFLKVKKSAETIVKYNDTYNTIERIDEINKMLENRFGENDLGAGGHRYFYESDYNVYNNENYMATVRHASSRTRLYEYLNEENPLGYYTGLGATFYYIDGDEYYNVPPIYDWNKIPGTTTRQGYLPQLNEIMSYATYNNTDNASGVSNGNIGASYVAQNREGVKVNQAYFMFDKGVVCLGSNINSSTINNIATTINQVNFADDAIFSKNGTKTQITLNSSLNDQFDYIYHDRISYITDAKINVEAKHKDGDWKTVSTRRKSEAISGDLLTLYINHGKVPHNENYDYTVLMNTTPELTDEYIKNPSLITVNNNKAIQAVYDNENNILQAIFHKAGSLTLPNGTTVNVNAPCVIILEDDSSLTISTYNFTEYDVDVTVNGKTQALSVNKTSQSFNF